MACEEGVLLTEPEEIQREALKHFEKLFEDISIDKDLTDI